MGLFLDIKEIILNIKIETGFTISKGHSAMGIYPILADIGYFKERTKKIWNTSGYFKNLWR